ncbi:MAG: diguanylate cyclase domain-containing protein [Bacillota bacterium]
MKQITNLSKKHRVMIILVIVGLIVINFPVAFYLKKISYHHRQEMMQLKLDRVAEKIKNRIFFRVRKALDTLKEHPKIIATFEQGAANDYTNYLINDAKQILDADTVYLMNLQGTVIASTTYGSSNQDFVGNDYSFRPYFKEAVAGNRDIYGAVGKTSNQRGFYFSAPVRDKEQIIGVLVIKVGLTEVDQILQEFSGTMLLNNPQGIVFASNQQHYLYRSLQIDKGQMVIDQRKHLANSINLEVNGWQLSILRPLQGFFHTAQDRGIFLAIHYVILGLGVVIVLLLINRCYRIQLEEELEVFSQVVEQSPVSVVITDTKGEIEYVNSAFERVTGYERQEVIGKNPRILKADKFSNQYYKDLWEIINNGQTWKGEFYNEKKNGDKYWERARITPLINSSGEIESFIGIKEDITEEKNLKKQLKYKAKRDEMTNLYNRRAGYQILEETIVEANRQGGCFSLAFVDINDLKLVNDNYGHGAGDEFIKHVADTLKNGVRDSDTVARLGGDEFIIIIANVFGEEAVQILERMQTALQELKETEAIEYPMSISYGIEEYTADKEIDSEELISRADDKMYQFKQEYKSKHK